MTVTPEALKDLCLEIAANAGPDPFALQIVAGKIRLVCGHHYGRKGLPLADAEMAAELLIAQVLTEYDDLHVAARGLRQ